LQYNGDRSGAGYQRQLIATQPIYQIVRRNGAPWIRSFQWVIGTQSWPRAVERITIAFGTLKRFKLTASRSVAVFVR
jgi:hypothetical protein